MVYQRLPHRAQRKRRPTEPRAAAELDEVFFALSHSARRLLLERLGHGGEPTVASLAAPLVESPAQITKHLAILERAGLISRRIEGREHRLTLVPGGMRLATDWVERHRHLWSQSLDRLEQLLDADAAAAQSARPARPKRGKGRGGP